MMMLLKIGYRNILRNRRRSVMTGLAVAAGTQALLLFGAFQANVFAGLEAGAVQRSGHLIALREGYFLYGAGNPSAYGINDYRGAIAIIAQDPVLRPLVNIVTPTLSFVGIAGNYSGSTSAAKTFLGLGFIPSDRVRMRQWNERGVALAFASEPHLSDDDATVGFVGVGLARILGLCGPLKISDCPPPPLLPSERLAVDVPAEDFRDLQGQDVDSVDKSPHASMPRLDLLAATASGAPNVVGLYVRSAYPQGVKELDENVIAMHLSLAQQLVYGRGPPKVTGITVQLHRTQDLEAARSRLSSLFIVNTMTMAVLERTTEIGTTRALGVKRGGIRRQFLLEGALLGAFGATAGVALAALVAFAINRAGLQWTPPANAQSIPFRVDLWGRKPLIVGTWMALTWIATLAAWVPAKRAAKLQIVDALRHV